MPELTLAANRIKTAASLAAKQYMGLSDTLKDSLSTHQIMQRKADGQTRDRFELFETAFRIQDAFQDHVKRVTAPYKYPREIEFVAELPKTISGKIRRVELRESEGAG